MNISINISKKTLIITAVVLLLAAVGIWFFLSGDSEPEGFWKGNGRIEATEIDVAAKFAGRVAEILVNEGDFVQANDVVARMDMQSIKAQLDEAKAQLANARSAKESAYAQVAQRQADVAAAEAVLAQRRSDLDVSRKTNKRLQALVKQGAVSQQDGDESAAKEKNARANVEAAKSQIDAAKAAVEAANAQVSQAEATIEAAQAAIERTSQDLKDAELLAPRSGRVQYRVVEPGEVIPAGGKVVSMIDVNDVYMTFFLPEMVAGKTALGAEVHIILDAVKQYVIPAEITFVSSVAQFTPKSVETKDERQKMMFRVKARINRELLEQYPKQVKTGLPGVAYVRLDETKPWPEELRVNLPGSAN